MGGKQDVLWEMCKWRIRESAQTFRARRILKLGFQDFPDRGMSISTIYTLKSCNVIISSCGFLGRYPHFHLGYLLSNTGFLQRLGRALSGSGYHHSVWN